MSEKIFGNANILTGKGLELVRGYLKVKDGVIQEIGSGDPNSYDIDVENGFIIPPFVNSHTHIADSVGKDLYIGRSQPQVVGEDGKKFQVMDNVSEEEKIEAMRETLTEMRNFGILAHCDFRERGIKGCNIFREVVNESIESLILSRPEATDDIDALLEVCDGLGFPSLEFLPEKELMKLADKVNELGKLLSVHVSESKEYHERSLQETGKTEIQRAVELNPSFLVHGTWATRDDLKVLSDREIPLVLCPRSNSLLSVGIPRFNQILEEDIDFWLGTDNVSVCSPNMFQELSYAWSILRLQSEAAGSEEARELLKAATIKPLKKLDISLEPIKENNEASFIILDRGKNLQRCEDPYVGIVNRARASNIRGIYDYRWTSGNIFKPP